MSNVLMSADVFTKTGVETIKDNTADNRESMSCVDFHRGWDSNVVPVVRTTRLYEHSMGLWLYIGLSFCHC